MNTETREVIEAHWQHANTKKWAEFARLLHPDLQYHVPQTREYIESGDGYLEMFRTWPGNWVAEIKHLICEGSQGVCVIDFIVGEEIMTGISIFQVSGKLIHQVTDCWPEPYEPPVRETKHLKRRAQ